MSPADCTWALIGVIALLILAGLLDRPAPTRDEWYGLNARDLRAGDLVVAGSGSGCMPGVYRLQTDAEGGAWLIGGGHAIPLCQVTIGDGILAGFRRAAT